MTEKESSILLFVYFTNVYCMPSKYCVTLLIDTKAVQSLWQVEVGSEKHGGNLHAGFVVLQMAQGQSEWKKIISAVYVL